jgi:quinohemoprotein ethanol dehydrogenase
VGALLAGLALTSCTRVAHPIEEAMVAGPDEWPSWGRTGHEAHYSPLDQIDTDAVGRLSLAWHFDLEPGYTPTTPLEAEGKLFLTTGHTHIRTLDARTGELLWEYDGGTRKRATSHIHMSWGSKGIAYASGRVFLGTTDGFVVALEAGTGKEVWKVRDFGPDAPRNMNGAPRVFDGKVLVGHGGADLSPIRGYVSAYDAGTGALAWRFYTVPGDPAQPASTRAEEIMRPTRKGDWFGVGGGGTVWNAMSYDPDSTSSIWASATAFPTTRSCAAPEAATTSSSPRSSRFTPTPANTRGTTRCAPPSSGTARRRPT